MLLPRSQSPPAEPASGTNQSIRPVLGSSISSLATTGQFRGTAISNAASKKALPNNGAAGFAVFRDDAASEAAPEGQEGWTDFGTNASRRKENIREAVPWKGEVLPMQSNSTLSQSQGARLEVFRDEVCIYRSGKLA